MIRWNSADFLDKRVIDFAPGDSRDTFSDVAVRLRCSWDSDTVLEAQLHALLAQPGIEELEALVFGLWMQGGESYEVSPDPALELLVTAKDKLPNLRGLFVGDIVSEENEISWIGQGNMAPLWSAFPKLERFKARGSNDLRLGRIIHENLTHLTIESGGLPRSVTLEAFDAQAPLTHLELWLGDSGYGATTTLEDLQPLLDGELFPDLRYLGLRNCEFGDELAEAAANSAILGRVDVLDLSMGTMGDKGASALAASSQIAHLKTLDLSENYISDDSIDALVEKTPNLEYNDQKTDTDYIYVSVSE